MIDFQYIKTKQFNRKNTKAWLKKVISNEEKSLGEIVYIFCQDEYLLQKNITFLNHNTLTDVISFDYSNGNIISGDIFISIERVSENAKKFKTEFLTELDRVMVHGLLHLLGYKDKQNTDSELMKKKEDYYLSLR